MRFVTLRTRGGTATAICSSKSSDSSLHERNAREGSQFSASSIFGGFQCLLGWYKRQQATGDHALEAVRLAWKPWLHQTDH